MHPCMHVHMGNNYNIGNVIVPIVFQRIKKININFYIVRLWRYVVGSKKNLHKTYLQTRYQIYWINQNKREYQINIENRNSMLKDFEGYQIKTKDFIDNISFL